MAAFGEDGTAAPIVRARVEGVHHAGGILGRQVKVERRLHGERAENAAGVRVWVHNLISLDFFCRIRYS